MNSYLRLFSKVFNHLNTIGLTSRTISSSACLQIKEIIETRQGNTLVIEGVLKDSERSPHVLNVDRGSACTLCALDLDLKHTDVLILSQYVRSDGCMLPKRVTGLCWKQQKRVSSLVTMAQKAGLMPNLTPANSKKDPKKRFGFKKFNKFFDETTIKW